MHPALRIQRTFPGMSSVNCHWQTSDLGRRKVRTAWWFSGPLPLHYHLCSVYRNACQTENPWNLTPGKIFSDFTWWAMSHLCIPNNRTSSSQLRQNNSPLFTTWELKHFCIMWVKFYFLKFIYVFICAFIFFICSFVYLHVYLFINYHVITLPAPILYWYINMLNRRSQWYSVRCLAPTSPWVHDQRWALVAKIVKLNYFSTKNFS